MRPASVVTRADEASAAAVARYLDRVAGVRRADCETLMALMRRVTGASPRLWGSRIVGFGERSPGGEWPLIGFSVNAQELTLYITADVPGYAGLMKRLGPHRASRTCFHIRALSEVDEEVVERLVEGAAGFRR